MKAYRVRDWNSIYENNRTRELKVLQWLPIPNRHDGDGYTLLLDRENGAALFGAWVAVLQVASRCDPRGTLLREPNLAHNSISLSRMTRIPKDLIDEMLTVCSKECRWLEVVEVECVASESQEDATIPQDDAGKSQEGALNGREENGKKRGAGAPKRVFTDAWCEAYSAHFGYQYAFSGAKDGAAADRLLKTGVPQPELIRIAKLAWGNPTGFNSKQAVSLAGFASRFNEIRAEVASSPAPAKPNSKYSQEVLDAL